MPHEILFMKSVKLFHLLQNLAHALSLSLKHGATFDTHLTYSTGLPVLEKTMFMTPSLVIYTTPPEILNSDRYRAFSDGVFQSIPCSSRKWPDLIVETLYPLIGCFYDAEGAPYVLPEIDDLFKDPRIFSYYKKCLPRWRNIDRGHAIDLTLRQLRPDAYENWPRITPVLAEEFSGYFPVSQASSDIPTSSKSLH